MSATPVQRPFTLLIAALGGEGGGVLQGWLVECARAAGLAVQATSVPGVAQRTGATSYYLEVATAAGGTPVFALSPVAGAVDVVLASELLEAGRMLERGFVSERTTLITSSSRVYTNLEKMHGGDGRFDAERLHRAGRELAGRYLAPDLQALAARHGTMISATLFGALAGADVLPWPVALCERVLEDEGGTRAAASLAGFRAAMAAVADAAQARAADAGPGATVIRVPDGLAARIACLPEALRDTATGGVARLIGYQDPAYAAHYLERLDELIAHPAADPARALTVCVEAARLLALWMSYEDIPRVAALKAAPERLARIRATAGARAGEIVQVTEHFKPGIDEIADMLPRALGAWLRRRARPGASLGKGIHLRTTAVHGYLALRLLAALGRWRRASLRFAAEQEAIDAWLRALGESLRAAPEHADQLVRLPSLRRGYGDTHARGLRNYRHLFDSLVLPALERGVQPADASLLGAAIDAALADPEGPALDRALRQGGAEVRPVVEKPIVWVERKRGARSSPAG